MFKKNLSIYVFFVLFCPVYAAAAEKEMVLTGKTMGSSYRITVVAGVGQSLEKLHEKIENGLEKINQEMSVYRKDSQVSRFNAIKESFVKFPVSEGFMEVLLVSKSVYEITGGAWDGTVNPMLELWGFRSKKTPVEIPPDKEIQKVLSRVGFDKILFEDDRHIMKKDPEISLDLASIAKGHGVDRASDILLENGWNNFIVEIGGEIYAAGKTADKKPWRVGINTPDKNAPFDDVYKIISLTDAGMATSGDYRNFVEIGGRRFSHIIDPRNGRPVKNNVASATVVAPTCTFADGLATAVMVMGLEKSLGLINRLKGVEAVIVTRDAEGVFRDHYSSGLSSW